MPDLYETDILLWSEQQRDLLRRLAAGEPVNEAPAGRTSSSKSTAWEASNCTP
jgi:hypothetical protein